MFSPYLPFCVSRSYSFCEWLHETFCLQIGLWPKGSDSSVLDAVVLQVSLELMACEEYAIMLVVVVSFERDLGVFQTSRVTWQTFLDRSLYLPIGQYRKTTHFPLAAALSLPVLGDLHVQVWPLCVAVWLEWWLDSFWVLHQILHLLLAHLSLSWRLLSSVWSASWYTPLGDCQSDSTSSFLLTMKHTEKSCLDLLLFWVPPGSLL